MNNGQFKKLLEIIIPNSSPSLRFLLFHIGWLSEEFMVKEGLERGGINSKEVWTSKLLKEKIGKGMRLEINKKEG